jgi:hypothetical protein
LLFPIPLLIKAASPFSPTSESEKNEGLTIKTRFSFRHSKSETDIQINPDHGGINHFGYVGYDQELGKAWEDPASRATPLRVPCLCSRLSIWLRP